MSWARGRGKLGLLKPLIGSWEAHADSPQGPVHCSRQFEKQLAGRYVGLRCLWRFGSPQKGGAKKTKTKRRTDAHKPYEELCLFGVAPDSQVAFWSFTSDGKQTRGVLTSAVDVHESAIAFEAQMPAGLARQVYWPREDGELGFQWAVESRTKDGWKRFVEHCYGPRGS